MTTIELCDELALKEGGRILLMVLDGLGGLAGREDGSTELRVACTPNLDRIARESSCGLLELIGPGITPGSGPGHLALFGYDPVQFRIGRGILSALGVDFPLNEGDVAARVNFATADDSGRIVDRRAGRIGTDINRRLCERLQEKITIQSDTRLFIRTVSEHRAVLVIRGDGLGGDVADTDPQETGIRPHEPTPHTDESRETAQIAVDFIRQAGEILAQEDQANTVLLRGFDRYRALPSLSSRLRLQGLCIARYPMYRGVSRLLGMDVAPRPENLEESLDLLESAFRADDEHDLFFVHFKDTDKKGEDSDFPGKVRAIERFDAVIPSVLQLDPHVLVVTGDHSTPSSMGAHSWHPVPILIRSRSARQDDVTRFDEVACAAGVLGMRRGIDVMPLAMAHAGRLRKFGA
jgi:2,3-bisphosphoglycerate-independent phosphoglycerate mutase